MLVTLVPQKQGIRLSALHPKVALCLQIPEHLLLAFMLLSEPSSVLNAKYDLIYFSKQLKEPALTITNKSSKPHCQQGGAGIQIRFPMLSNHLLALLQTAPGCTAWSQVAFPLGFLESEIL